MARKKRWDNKKKKKRKKTLHDDVFHRLHGLYQAGRGRSRNEDKKLGIDQNYIYASRTYETYKREGKHFVDWCIHIHPDIRHLKDCAPFANDYIQYQINKGYSPYTIATRKAAIAKLLDIPCKDLMPTPSRNRASIQRSRCIVERDKHISAEKEAFFAKITSATGLRRNELLKVMGSDLRIGKKEDGAAYYYLHITRGTKGGKLRDAEIIGIDEKETLEIVNLFKNCGNARLFSRIPNAYDNHHYRAVYAKRIYGKYARRDIPPKDRYIMRKDRAGEVLDKRAMWIASRALGHNRIDVIANNYLY